MDPGDSRLRVLVADDRGRSVRVNGLAAWLRRVAPAKARGTVSIALVSDARMRTLNREYRRKDYATDVLSFPSAEKGVRPLFSDRVKRDRTPFSPTSRLQPPAPLLGDIVIARGVAKRQAREAGHSEGTELRVLALHGLLHLLGYDHERDNGRMRRVEARLRRKGGLGAGLIERAARPFTEQERVNGKIRSVSDRKRATALSCSEERMRRATAAGVGPRRRVAARGGQAWQAKARRRKASRKAAGVGPRRRVVARGGQAWQAKARRRKPSRKAAGVGPRRE